jgi:hypothetical protein
MQQVRRLSLSCAVARSSVDWSTRTSGQRDEVSSDTPRAHLQPIGRSATSVPEQIAACYAEVLAELGAALVLWRRAEQTSSAGSGRSRNALACSCGCGRRIRVARSVLELARSCAAPAPNRFSPRTTRPVDAYASPLCAELKEVRSFR